MRTAGIRGLGPESTVDYYRYIIARYRARKPDGGYPHLLINSLDVEKGIAVLDAGRLDDLVDYLAAGVGTLVRAGADFAVIAANTPHLVFDEVQRRSAIASLSIVRATGTYTYDDSNRLANATAPGQTWPYSYDQFGNRWHAGGQNLTFTYNNHIDGFSYDAEGNVLYDGSHHYLYDAENRLISIDSGATTYVYDADGRRIAKQQGGNSTREFLYDLEGSAMTEIQPGVGWVHSDVFGGGKLWSTINWYTTTFHTSDWLGTRRLDSDNCGNATYGYKSLPFGDGLQTVTLNPPCTGANTPDTERHFTGKERDTESGNDYFGARYYASSMGRWLSPDWSPIPAAVPYAKLENPQTLNLYAYVGNNPLGRVDKDGHDDYTYDQSGKQTGYVKRGFWHNFFQGNSYTLNADNGKSYSMEAALKPLSGGQRYTLVGAQQQNMDKVAMSAETAAIKPTRDSVKNGNYHEYGGLILERDSDGHISSTKPISGQERTVDVDSIHVPKGYTVVGEYHTHPHATAAEGQGPSTADIYRLRTPERASRVGYVVDSYSGVVYRYTQSEPVRGPYDTKVYGTAIGTIP